MKSEDKLLELEKLAIDACSLPVNRFGNEYYDEHILLCRDYARSLAHIVGADEFVLDASAYLHDLGVIQDYGLLSRHEEAGADIATRELKRLDVGSDIIDRVRECILQHSKPVWRGESSPEAVCFSNADAMAIIARPAFWLRYAWLVKGMSYREGCRWLLDWYETLWNGMVDEALTITASDYRSARKVLAGQTGAGIESLLPENPEPL